MYDINTNFIQKFSWFKTTIKTQSDILRSSDKIMGLDKLNFKEMVDYLFS